jgi:hypothetical protein
MLKVRRVLSVLCLFVFLGLPLAAQTERETVSPVASFLEIVWERLSAPFAPVTAIWQADEGVVVEEDPNADPLPSAGNDWDPFG